MLVAFQGVLKSHFLPEPHHIIVIARIGPLHRMAHQIDQPHLRQGPADASGHIPAFRPYGIAGGSFPTSLVTPAAGKKPAIPVFPTGVDRLVAKEEGFLWL